MKEEVANQKTSANCERKNFVKLNQKQCYNPRMRGAAYTNKVMAKKTNQLKFRARTAAQMKIEQLKNRDKVNMYGGLGKVGLDYQHEHAKEDGEYQVPAFSSKLMHLAESAKKVDEDEEMLDADLEDMHLALAAIDEEIADKVEEPEEEI